MGACIQCSVKTCKTAYHVTCAFKHNLEMRAIIEDENAEDGVKLRVRIGVLFSRDIGAHGIQDSCRGSGRVGGQV